MNLAEPSFGTVAARLALASLLALPLGWRGGRVSPVGGLRAHALVAMCVCGFLLIAQRPSGSSKDEADVFYGVLSGIGFVGYGAITKSRRHAHGLTSAVGLWVTGAIGAGVAFGLPLLSAFVSLVSAGVLVAPKLLRPGKAIP